ncbi:MAG: hypothetical protein SO294_09715, partial [Prevotella sp.]|nr:hypothetical protein [Prevotella sp.]
PYSRYIHKKYPQHLPWALRIFLLSILFSAFTVIDIVVAYFAGTSFNSVHHFQRLDNSSIAIIYFW